MDHRRPKSPDRNLEYVTRITFGHDRHLREGTRITEMPVTATGVLEHYTRVPLPPQLLNDGHPVTS